MSHYLTVIQIVMDCLGHMMSQSSVRDTPVTNAAIFPLSFHRYQGMLISFHAERWSPDSHPQRLSILMPWSVCSSVL